MSGKKILFIESFNCTPHLETAFELAKMHLEQGDIVHFDFIGHALTYDEGWSLLVRKRDVLFDRMLPENRGAKLLKNHHQFFYRNHFKLKQSGIDTDQFTDMETLKHVFYKDVNIGLGVVSSLISKYRISILELENKKILEDVQSGLKSASQVVDFTNDRVNQIQPDIFYVFNGRFCNVRPIYEISLKRQIKFRIHERGSSMLKYECFDSLPHDRLNRQKQIQDIQFPLTKLKIEANDFFSSRRKRKSKDWHSFVKNQKTGKLPQLSTNKRIITYFQSSDDENIAVGDFYKWDLFKNQLDVFINLLDIVSDTPNLQLVLRMHPNMRSAKNELKNWEDLDLPQDVVYVGPEEDIDSYELMEHSDLVVVAGSTMGIESVYWGIPCMSLGPSLYSELNAVFIPRVIEDIKWALQHIEKLPIGREGAIKYGAYMNTFGENYEYYKAESLVAGELMGNNLQKYNQNTYMLIRKKLKNYIILYRRKTNRIYRYTIKILKKIPI